MNATIKFIRQTNHRDGSVSYEVDFGDSSEYDTIYEHAVRSFEYGLITEEDISYQGKSRQSRRKRLVSAYIVHLLRENIEELAKNG